MTVMNKYNSFAQHRANGEYNSTTHGRLAYTPCLNGKAGEFRCNNVDLYDFVSHADLGNKTSEGSSTWGRLLWRDGRLLLLLRCADGTAFSEVTEGGKLDCLGHLPQQSTPEVWREIRVLRDYAAIGSEAVTHFVQIFDMRKVAAVGASEKPKTFSTSTDLTSLFTGLPVVGAALRTSACRSGLIFIDLTNPANPTNPGCASQDGYVHDAQCLKCKGPDTRYKGKDICYGYNKDTLTIYDVTNKRNTSIISRASYTGAAYMHQSWLLDTENQEYLILDDEYDEYDGVGLAADGYPQTGYYKSGQYGIDHNQYIANGKVYQSNYGGGLWILDVSSIPKDPSGKGVKEVGFFDVYPEDDVQPKGGVLDFVGTWASHALFRSEWMVNTIERGAFVVKYTGK
ncbi:hypothetical protein L873DRAFT_1834993 [Choiromyces venosus 120613-1]|uniref:Uncharacterized protein n=1 Tax=Choiromyces venosus 120613-1 TaxID=1336337 RepID=A0A3N4JUK4_9PEZI|nr:hypothetical protein L873DRAFT_1834993 [Choiromyces venosus 120613-1]